jgi:hypothetical protein
MIGQLGHFHKRRTKLVDHLRQHGLPVLAGPAPREAAAQSYSESIVSLNCSLNGDLNLRVFEILSAGGFLWTDKLAHEAGMDLLFQEGVEFVSFASQQELLEKARYFLQHPDEAAVIAQGGHRRFLESHMPEVKAKAILDWVFEGRLDPLYDPRQDERAMFAPEIGLGLEKRLMVYEAIQEAHLSAEITRVLFESTVPKRIASDVRDLPRVEMSVLLGADARSDGVTSQQSPLRMPVSEIEARSTTWDFVIWPSQSQPALLAREIKATKGLILV